MLNKARELSAAQCAQIKILRQQNYSIRKIAVAVNVSKSAVAYTLKRIAEKQTKSTKASRTTTCNFATN